MKKVLITIGHKKRELLYLSLLAAELEKNNFEVKILYSNFEVYWHIATWKPDILLLGQVNQNENIAVAEYASKSGTVVAVLNCEGIYDPKEKITRFGSHINDIVDILFAWGKQHYLDAIRSTDISPEKVFITGTPKFDIYKPPLRDYFKKTPVKNKKYSDKKTICISTSLTMIGVKWSQVKHNVIYKRQGKESFERHTILQKRIRKELIALAKQLACSGKYVIIFRPHPLEPVNYYKSQFAHDSLITVTNSMIPLQLFSVIDLLIHRSSTLATEAWICNIPTASYDPVYNLDGNIVDMSLIEPLFHSKASLIKWIDDGYTFSSVVHQNRLQYLKDWYSIDEHDTETAARKITKVFSTIEPKRKKLTFHLFLLIYCMLSVMKTIFIKEYIYEVIAVIKGDEYLTKMRELFITDSETTIYKRAFSLLLKTN